MTHRALVHFFLLEYIILLGCSTSLTRAGQGEIDPTLDFSNFLEVEKCIIDQLPIIKPAVVSIETQDGAGSGVIISQDGLILTAAHVIEHRGREMKVILSDGSTVQSVSLGGSEISDAGMLKIIEGGPWPFVPMAKSGSAKVGDWCIALGHPSGYDSSRGMVLRAGQIISKDHETIQTNCRLLGGDSGGPLFSIQGEVIATHSRISKSDSDNFHTPIESFLANWEYFLSKDIHTIELIHSGGFLGLACEETTKGLEVIKVVAQSPAERMGMLEGDILLSFNQTPLTTRENLIILVSQKPPGETVTLHYKRNNREVSVQGRLGTRTPP